MKSSHRVARLGLPIAALAAGLLQAASIAAPWDGQPLWWLQILSLSTLVALLSRAGSVRAAAVLGWVFALAWIAGSTWWLFISMHRFGGLAAPLAALAVLALAGFLALYYAAACAVWFYLVFKSNARGASVSRRFFAIIFVALWLMAELARNTWGTGFPWGAGGYAHVDGPLAPLSGWVGVFGVGVAASAIAAALAQWLEKPTLSRVVAAWVWAAPLALALWIAQQPQGQSAGSTNVALLQGNISQGEKFDHSKGIPVALQWYAEQLKASTATLTVTPETAIPMLPHQLPAGYWSAIHDRFASGAQAALVGVPLGNFEAGYTNSAVGLPPPAVPPGAQSVMQPQPYRYSKHHLVPFGEFIPTGFRWFTQLMQIPLGDFNRGDVGQASFEFAGQRWAPNICYEDLFGEELAARFIDPGAAPTVLVNLSNIAWFGDSIAIDQHLQISRMRALELGRPMLRATNTGATAIIDHTGRVSTLLPRATRGVLQGSVEGRTGITPYAWWAGRVGLWPLWLLAAAVLALAVRMPGRRKMRG